jgi:hypothetical protein
MELFPASTFAAQNNKFAAVSDDALGRTIRLALTACSCLQLGSTRVYGSMWMYACAVRTPKFQTPLSLPSLSGPITNICCFRPTAPPCLWRTSLLDITVIGRLSTHIEAAIHPLTGNVGWCSNASHRLFIATIETLSASDVSAMERALRAFN